MRYDRDWLIGISDTQHIIECAPIDKVPIRYRALLKQQFECHVEAFRTDLSLGFNTTKSQAAIADLGYLALELVEEHEKEKAKAADCAAYAHPAYGR